MSSLSRREREVTRCVMRALENKEIADELKISSETVKKYMESARTKLRARNRVELAVKAVRDPSLVAVMEEEIT